MIIQPLSEGIFTIGHDKIFHPFNPETDSLQERSIGSLMVELQPFLLQVGQQNIIIDTGLGYRLPNGELQIHHNLATIGLKPTDIHKVILSHLHKDHSGGIFFTNNLGIEDLSFPNATYYVGREEFDYALEKGAPSYVLDDFILLGNNPQVEWLNSEGVIDNFIFYHTSGGHCPYHQCFLFDDGQQKVFYGGDVAPQMKQLKTKYVAKYDYDGQLSMARRQEYAAIGREQQWTFLFYHDVHLPYGILS